MFLIKGSISMHLNERVCNYTIKNNTENRKQNHKLIPREMSYLTENYKQDQIEASLHTF